MPKRKRVTVSDQIEEVLGESGCRWTTVPNRGGGDCFFHSVAGALRGTPLARTHLELRAEVAHMITPAQWDAIKCVADLPDDLDADEIGPYREIVDRILTATPDPAHQLALFRAECAAAGGYWADETMMEHTQRALNVLLMSVDLVHMRLVALGFLEQLPLAPDWVVFLRHDTGYEHWNLISCKRGDETIKMWRPADLPPLLRYSLQLGGALPP